MDDPDLEPEVQMTRQDMFVALAWVVGPVGYLWIALKIATTLFPDGNPYLLMASVVLPEAAVLYGIGRWRKRKNT